MTPGHSLAPNFQSGGRNPNWQKTCYSCGWLEQGKDMTGGWCKNPANHVPAKPGDVAFPEGFAHPVSWTGGCDLHTEQEAGS